MKLRRIGLAAIAAAALALLCTMHIFALLRTPAAFFPASISVRVNPGEAITLGQQELAAPGADRAHLALRRDPAGRWFLHNASSGRALLVQRDGEEHRTGAARLAAGSRFQLGATRFQVQQEGASLVLVTDGHSVRYDGATVWRDNEAQGACPDARFATRLLGAWNRFTPAALRLARPLVFGGSLHCGNRIGIAGVDGGAASIVRAQGFMLASAGQTPLMLDGADLAHQEEFLDGIKALVIGRTRLLVTTDGAALALRPAGHVALFAQAQTTLPPQVTWRWQQRQIWALPPAARWPAIAALIGALAIALALRTPARKLAFSAAGLLIAFAGAAAFVLQRSGAAPGIGVSMLLAWAALWYLLLAPGRLTLVTIAGVLLLAIGLLAQLELGLGGAESSWLRHVQKTACLLAVGAGLGVQLRLHHRTVALPQSRLEWLLAGLAACALVALLLQVLFGDETGVFDIQPVEFAKLALTALTAHCLALGMGAQAIPGGMRRWLRLAAPALLFIALLALALVQVDDFSPLILLLVWSTSMALAYALASRNYGLVAALAAIALLCVAAVAGLRSAGPAGVAQWSFYGDRFLVWLDPATHPHTGQQMLAGARAIADGGWWGSDSLLGVSTLGHPAGAAMHIPAVQDDFAPSFFLNRHGLAAALVLWLLQALFIVGLLQVAAHAWRAGTDARDFRLAWSARFRCFALCGGAAFVLGHLMLSWGTNLAIFPIMGQPMSFLSAGGSHLLFFICPLLAFGAFSAQSFEEK